MSEDLVSYQILRGAIERQEAPKGGLDWYYRENTKKTGRVAKSFFVFRRLDSAD